MPFLVSFLRCANVRWPLGLGPSVLALLLLALRACRGTSVLELKLPGAAIAAVADSPDGDSDGENAAGCLGTPSPSVHASGGEVGVGVSVDAGW